jgi:hypothetical protein
VQSKVSMGCSLTIVADERLELEVRGVLCERHLVAPSCNPQAEFT